MEPSMSLKPQLMPALVGLSHSLRTRLLSQSAHTAPARLSPNLSSWLRTTREDGTVPVSLSLDMEMFGAPQDQWCQLGGRYFKITTQSPSPIRSAPDSS